MSTLLRRNKMAKQVFRRLLVGILGLVVPLECASATVSSTVVLVPITVTGGTPTSPFPLSVSNGVLQTAGGQPYLILADAPQGANNLPLCSAGNTYALCSASGDTIAGAQTDATQRTFVAYLKDRKAQGFNALWINILCEAYTRCNNNGSTQENTFPFTTQLTGSVQSPDNCPENGSVTATPGDSDCWDLSTVGGNANGRNTVLYWQHIDGYIQLAADQGMMIIADPIPTDACNPTSPSGAFLGGGSFGYTFLNNYVNAGNTYTKLNAYADFLANRYSKQSSPQYSSNLIWFLFNDYVCWNSTAYPSFSISGSDTVFYNFTARLAADENQAGYTKHLLSSELFGNTDSLSDTLNTWSNYITLNGVYYNLGPSYDGGLLAVSQSAAAPAIFSEGAYQGEDLGGNDDGSNTGTNMPGCGTNQILVTTGAQNSLVNGNTATCAIRDRGQFWKLLLTGAAGFIDGNSYTWQFSSNWWSSGATDTGHPSGSCTGTSPAKCLDTPTNAQLSAAATFLLNNAWYKIKPDYTRGVNGSGVGIGNAIASPFINPTGCYGSNTCANYYRGSNNNNVNTVPKGVVFDAFVVSGAASDGTFGMAYVQGVNPGCTYPSGTTNCTPQTSQSITFNMNKVNGGSNLTAAWYDPTGAMTSPTTTICSPSTTRCNSTSQTFTTPSSAHSDGAADWVLLIH
jgi:hypothetical protein